MNRKAELDPAEVVYNYFMKGSKNDVDGLHRLVDELDGELVKIRQQLVGLDRLGSGVIEAQSFLSHLRRALAPIKSRIENIDHQAEKLSR